MIKETTTQKHLDSTTKNKKSQGIEPSLSPSPATSKELAYHISLSKKQGKAFLQNYRCFTYRKGINEETGKPFLYQKEGWKETGNRPKNFMTANFYGILCGEISREGDSLAVYVLDADTRHKGVSDKFKAWLREYLAERQGEKIMRVGGYPEKFALFFVSEPDQFFENTEVFLKSGKEKTQLECLGKTKSGKSDGCRVYGEHKTGLPYYHSDFITGEPKHLADYTPENLVYLNASEVEQIRSAFVDIVKAEKFETVQKLKERAETKPLKYRDSNNDDDTPRSELARFIREEKGFSFDKLIESNGFHSFAGSRCSKNKDTHNPGGYKGDKGLFTHDDDDAPFCDGYWHDEVSLYIEAFCSGSMGPLVRDYKETVDAKANAQRRKEYAENRRLEDLNRKRLAVGLSEIEKEKTQISDATETLLQRILKSLKVKLNLADFEDGLELNGEQIEKIINNCFWSGVAGKMFVVASDSSMLQFNQKDFSDYMQDPFLFPGKLFNKAFLEDKADAAAMAGGLSEKDREKYIKAVLAIPLSEIVRYLKIRNQREKLNFTVDMFTVSDYLVLHEDCAELCLEHRPFKNPDPLYSDEILSDYKEHFAELDLFIDFIVHSRFIPDRKTSYLWLHADSDFGKNFLLEMFKSVGAVVSLSMSEVEKCFEGNPVGLDPTQFKRQMVLFLDEFKSAKSELKQLQKEMTLSPKNKLQSTVQIYAKILCSAEDVPSLNGGGVPEDQFSNRICYMRKYGKLTDRPLFMEDRSRYWQTVFTYLVERLNAKIADLRRVGKKEAEKISYAWIDRFCEKYLFKNLYPSISQEIPVMAEAFLLYVNNFYRGTDLIFSGTGCFYIRRPAKLFEEFIEHEYSSSTKTMMKKKSANVIGFLSEGGVGAKSHKVDGHTIKAIKIAAEKDLILRTVLFKN